MSRRAINISVRPLKKDTPEKLIRRFRRKVKKAGILDEVKRRKYYKKPSEVKREKIIRRKRETAKLERKKK
jgi:small subunit ribosomal protein S21